MHFLSPRGAAIRCAVLFTAAALLPITPAAAESPSENGFDVSGSFRIRGDAIDGQFRPGKAEDDAILMLRTTLLASYTITPVTVCLLYTSPSPRDATLSRMPSSA